MGVGPYKHSRGEANKTLLKMVAMYRGGGGRALDHFENRSSIYKDIAVRQLLP